MSAAQLELPASGVSRDHSFRSTVPVETAVALPDRVDQVVSTPGPFAEDDEAAFQSDDAMAGGMISIILSLAFCVLVALVVGVSYWTVAATTP